MIRKLEQLEELVAGKTGKKMVVAAAHDDNVLISVKEVYEKGYVDPILIGDKEKILKISEEIGLNVSGLNIIKELDDNKSARLAVDMVNDGGADILMKGHIMTGDLMKVALNKEKGLRTNRIISHIGIFEVKDYPKLLFLTDAGINISPDLKQKAEIIQNAVYVAQKLKIEHPKVAVLSAVEVINPSIQSTIDAAALAKMAQRGQITGCTVDGPLSMDNAINLDAALHKHIESDVAGDADILVAPNIESANILLKTLVFLFKAGSCAAITGARAPMVVTSRAEDSLSKYYSILLAIAMS